MFKMFVCLFFFVKWRKSILVYQKIRLLNEFESKGILASRVSTYEFSTLYITLSQYLLNKSNKLLLEPALYSACNEKRAFLSSEQPKRYNLWSSEKVCDFPHYLLDKHILYLARNGIDTLYVSKWVLIVSLFL